MLTLKNLKNKSQVTTVVHSITQLVTQKFPVTDLEISTWNDSHVYYTGKIKYTDAEIVLEVEINTLETYALTAASQHGWTLIGKLNKLSIKH